MQYDSEPAPGLGFIKIALGLTCAASIVTACLSVYQEVRTERVIRAVENVVSQLKGERGASHAGAALLDMLPSDSPINNPAQVTEPRIAHKVIQPADTIWQNGIRFRREGREYVRTDMPDLCGQPDPTIAGGYPRVCLAQ